MRLSSRLSDKSKNNGEIESFIELSGRNVQGPVKLLEEFMDSVFLILDVHALDCELDNVYCCE